MLFYDLKKTPDEQLIDALTQKCSVYGLVLRVRINREAETHALVKMANNIEAIQLRQDLGDELYGQYVKIKLEQNSTKP